MPRLRDKAKAAAQGDYRAEAARRFKYTTLPPKQEQAFKLWVLDNKVPFDPSEATPDYDMRGFYKGLQSNDPRAKNAIDPNDRQLHFPDVWKAPSHPTFSADAESASPSAPRWYGDRYLIDKNGNTLFDDAKGEMTPSSTTQDASNAWLRGR